MTICTAKPIYDNWNAKNIDSNELKSREFGREILYLIMVGCVVYYLLLSCYVCIRMNNEFSGLKRLKYYTDIAYLEFGVQKLKTKLFIR